jgi:hypothetical protein
MIDSPSSSLEQLARQQDNLLVYHDDIRTFVWTDHTSLLALRTRLSRDRRQIKQRKQSVASSEARTIYKPALKRVPNWAQDGDTEIKLDKFVVLASSMVLQGRVMPPSILADIDTAVEQAVKLANTWSTQRSNSVVSSAFSLLAQRQHHLMQTYQMMSHLRAICCCS